jgi:hypothetical protein
MPGRYKSSASIFRMVIQESKKLKQVITDEKTIKV